MKGFAGRRSATRKHGVPAYRREARLWLNAGVRAARD